MTKTALASVLETALAEDAVAALEEMGGALADRFAAADADHEALEGARSYLRILADSLDEDALEAATKNATGVVLELMEKNPRAGVQAMWDALVKWRVEGVGVPLVFPGEPDTLGNAEMALEDLHTDLGLSRNRR